MRDEIALMYDGLELTVSRCRGPGRLNSGPCTAPFLVGRYECNPVCCGGLKRLDARTCELKKMYVVPELRGKGVAQQLLHALERKARELGYAVARLDTGPKQM